MNTIPKTHFFTEKDLPLYELNQIFAAGAVWLENGMDTYEATFDLVVRDLPQNRNFLVFSGLEEVLERVKRMHYPPGDIRFLLRNDVITPRFAEYLENFRFQGNIYALKEGTIFFPGEPIIRVTAPLIEANLLTMLLLIAIPSNTIPISKLIRCVIAAQGKKIITGAGMRANSFETAMKYGRAAYIAGALGPTTVASFTRKFHLPFQLSVVNAYHAYIKSFPSELEAMRAMGKLYKGNVNMMIDTYDTDQGLEHFMVVCKELQKAGYILPKVTIDSGDVLQETKKVRKRLDAVGLEKVEIMVAGNLDEFKIQQLVQAKIPADSFLVHTETLTVSDDPKLEAVYKLAELHEGEKVRYTAKLAAGKQSYPGKKQVFRVYEHGRLKEDIIGLDEEKVGKKLLVKMMEKGKVCVKMPTLNETKMLLQEELQSLPPRYLSLEGGVPSPVRISAALEGLFSKVKLDLKKEKDS